MEVRYEISFLGGSYWEKVKIKDICLNTADEYKVVGITDQTVMLEGLEGR